MWCDMSVERLNEVLYSASDATETIPLKQKG